MGHSARRESDDGHGFGLAAERVLICAERAALEGHILHKEGFAPIRAVGLEALLWRRGGRLYTTDAALEEAGIIRDQKEEQT